MIDRKLLTLAACLTILGPGVALAQTPAPAPPFVVRWNNGLSVESADGATKFQFGTLLQGDGRFALNTPSPITDTFLLRRVRFIVQGRLAKYFEFYIAPDFANSSLTLFDAFIDTKFSDAFRIRMGKSKAPHGLEQNYSDATLPFVERSAANFLVPTRDVGLTVLGDLFKSRVSYAGGVENGVADGATGDTDSNGGKDLVGRVLVRLGAAGFALSGTRGQEVGALPSFKTLSQQTYFSYASGVAAAGTRSRVAPSLFVFHKSVGAYAEYFRTTQEVAKGGASTAVTNSGWNATGVVVLTGEAATERGATPNKPFDPAAGHWGAVQLAVRVSELRVDPQVFSLGYAGSGASRVARAIGVGVVWYNNANVKHMLTFERTVFDGNAGGPRKAENALVFRIQVSLSPRL